MNYNGTAIVFLSQVTLISPKCDSHYKDPCNVYEWLKGIPQYYETKDIYKLIKSIEAMLITKENTQRRLFKVNLNELSILPSYVPLVDINKFPSQVHQGNQSRKAMKDTENTEENAQRRLFKDLNNKPRKRGLDGRLIDESNPSSNLIALDAKTVQPPTKRTRKNSSRYPATEYASPLNRR